MSIRTGHTVAPGPIPKRLRAAVAIVSALAALGRGRFTAAMRNCRRVPVVAIQEFNFRLIR